MGLPVKSVGPSGLAVTKGTSAILNATSPQAQAAAIQSLQDQGFSVTTPVATNAQTSYDKSKGEMDNGATGGLEDDIPGAGIVNGLGNVFTLGGNAIGSAIGSNPTSPAYASGGPVGTAQNAGATNPAMQPWNTPGGPASSPGQLLSAIAKDTENGQSLDQALSNAAGQLGGLGAKVVTPPTLSTYKPNKPGTGPSGTTNFTPSSSTPPATTTKTAAPMSKKTLLIAAAVVIVGFLLLK